MSRSATRSGEFIARGHLKLDHAEFTARAGCTQDPEGHRVSGSAYDERRETRTAATHFIVIARYISYSQPGLDMSRARVLVVWPRGSF